MISNLPDPALREALKLDFCRLVDDTPHLTAGPDRAQWLIDSTRILNQAHALFALVLADFDRNHDYALDGALGVVPWMAHKLHLAHPEAKRQAATARRLQDCPLTEDAFQHGEISFDRAVKVTQTMEAIGGNQAAEPFRDEQGNLPPLPEQLLVDAARRELPRHFHLACQRIRFYLQPEQALAGANAQYRREYLQLSPIFDGRWVLKGELCPEHGTLLATTLDALLRPVTPDNQRSASERRATALMDAMEHLLTAQQVPASGGERPHLALVTDLRSLRQEPGGEVSFLDYTGQPVPGKLAQRIACDCWLTPIVVDAEGDVLKVGRRRRTFSPRQRQALARRDGGCAFPGCDRPPGWCEGHHVTPWWQGGGTDVDNGMLLCSRHHTLVHQAGWTLTRDPETGAYEALPP